MRIYYYYY